MSQTRSKPDHGSSTNAVPRTLRWVKVFGIIVAGLVLLFVALHLTGNGFGNQMQMMHMSPTQSSGQQP